MTSEKEVKKKSNPDYTPSAVKLINPPEVKGLLDEWVAARKLLDEANGLFQAALAEIPELPEAVKAKEAFDLLAEARQNVETAIKEFGGYQDTEQGLYALQQTRKTVTYDAELVKKHIGRYVSIILSQVDVTALKGLLKGKLITQEQVDQCSTTKESLRFVIEAVS